MDYWGIQPDADINTHEWLWLYDELVKDIRQKEAQTRAQQASQDLISRHRAKFR